MPKKKKMFKKNVKKRNKKKTTKKKKKIDLDFTYSINEIVTFFTYQAVQYIYSFHIDKYNESSGACYCVCPRYEVHTISFLTFFVWAFKIVVDSWKFSILWDDWPIFMISGSNE